ncbi:DUF4347 domain-containing protein [Gluconacetobacter sp. Hr-1-5]|uniref:DUF4347 domain-containing protein n=1 Tax=Gluconacetobacter sp. Hr-1-5 TaxID=3395370 RepID=UPI003B524CCE
MRLILEQRYLFDGSIAHIAHHHAHHDGIDTHEGTAVADAMEAVADAPPAAGTSRPEPGHTDHSQAPTLADSAAAAGPLTAIVFVDSRVTDWKELTASLPDTVGVVVVSPDSNGMDVVSRVLAHQQDLQSVSFLTYGQPGAAELGSSTINEATVAADSRQVTGWGDALAPGGQILFWGCDVGQGADGQALVDDLHTLTGADIAASTDKTGLATLGGDWTLEQTAGISSAQVGSPFSAQAQADYQSVLDSSVPNATMTIALAGSQSDILLGNTFTENLTFKNDGTGTGYSPFVEVFAPNNSKQVTPLQSLNVVSLAADGSATVLESLSPTAVTLVKQDGVVGATNPLTKQWVNAPSGMVAGDTMYVAALPFGSYTVGQPTIDMQATFGTTTASVTSALTGVTAADGTTGGDVSIYAAGGYQLGASATGGTPVYGSTAEASSPLDLLNIQSQVITSEGEDESPTGSDFVNYYQVTVTPGDITTDNAIGKATITVKLPDQVTYNTSGTISVTGSSSTPSYKTPVYTPDPAATAGQGGTVSVELDNISAANGTTTIKIPVYVGQTDVSGAQILTADTTTGNVAPQQIPTPTEAYSAGTWTAPANSPDYVADSPVSFTDVSIAAAPGATSTFDAKAFAIQETATDTATGSSTENSTTEVMPGDTISHKVSLESSDYYASNLQTLTETIQDGQTLLAGNGATLKYTDMTGASQTVTFAGITSPVTSTQAGTGDQISTGTGSNWSYVADLTTGITTVSYNLADNPNMKAGTTASLTYTTQANTTFIDPLHAGQPVTEGDTLKTSVTATANLLDTSGNPILVNGTSGAAEYATDDSQTTLTVPESAPTLAVYAINGSTTNAATTPIKAGDLVTYAVTYPLKTGTYAGLDLTSYLPEPLFATTDPTVSGTVPATAPYSEASSEANVEQTAGSYYVTSTGPAITIASATAASGPNSVEFKLNPVTTSTSDQTVTILYTVKATDAPYADGLQMTSQEQSNFTDGQGGTTAVSKIVQSTVGSPQAELKTGVVSIVHDGTDSGAINYTLQDPSLTSGSTDPTKSYEAANTTAAGVSPFVNSTDPNTSGLVQQDDLNATGANGGDTARIATTVENSGSGDMYALTVSGTTPTIPGMTAAQVQALITNMAVTTSGGATYALTGPELTAYFSTSGLNLSTVLNSGGSTTGEVLAAATKDSSGNITAANSLTITYDLSLPDGIDAGSVVTAGAQVVSYTNTANTDATNFVNSSGVQLGATDGSDISDAATITVQSPTISQVLSASSINGVGGTTDFNGMDQAGADKSVETVAGTEPADNTVVAGEQRTTTVTVNVPQGQLTNGSDDVTVTVTLPKGVTYVDQSGAVTADSNVVLSGGTQGVKSTTDTNGVTTLTFDLGKTVANTTSSTAPISLTYTANYTNAMASNGQDLTPLTATLNYAPGGGSSTPLAANDLVVKEQEPKLTESFTSAPTSAYSNEAVSYTATIKNTGPVTAYDVTVNPVVPASLTGVTYSFAQGSFSYSGSSITNLNSTINTYLTNLAAKGLAADQTLTYTINGTVAQNLTVGTQVKVTDNVTANSVPADTTTTPLTPPDVVTTGTQSTTSTVGSVSAVLSIVGEANGTAINGPGANSPQSNVRVVPGDVITLRGTATLPQGSNDIVLNFALPPANLTLDTSSVKIELISPDGQMRSTTLDALLAAADKSSTSSGVQTSGTTAAGAIATQALTVADGTDVTYADGVLSINLGTVTENNSSGSGGSSYVVVDMKATVNNDTSNISGTTIGAGNTEKLTLTANGTATTPSAVTEDVREPNVTLTKTVSNITGNSVTYVDTLKNTGSNTATAYGVNLYDPLDASNETYVAGSLSLSGLASTTGTTDGALPAINGAGNAITGNFTLGGGETETITYTVNLTVPTEGAAETKATVNWLSLKNAIVGATGGVTESRDGSATVSSDGNGNTTRNNYSASVTTGLAAISGQVWQALGNDPTAYDSATDTPLGNVTVTVTSAGADGDYTTTGDNFSQTVKTTPSNSTFPGTYSVLAPIYGTTTQLGAVTATGAASLAQVSLPDANADGLPANETLIYNADNPDATTANDTATVSPDGGGTGVVATGVNMAFALADKAPVLSVTGAATGWGGTPVTGYADGTTAVALGSGTVTVTDAEIDNLLGKATTDPTGAAGKSGDSYAGTVLTVQRYVSGTAQPSGADSFGFGTSGTVAFGADSTVTVNHTEVGTYTQSGGKLVVTFDTPATASSIADVIQNLTYTYTPGSDTSGMTGVTIGATLSDGNTGMSGLSGTYGPQGTGGVQTSTPLLATVDIPPPSGFTATYTEPNDPGVGSNPAVPASAVQLEPALSLTDASGGSANSIQKATIQITNVQAAEDVLQATAAAANGLSATYDSNTGILTLTPASGTATLAQWQAALQSVAYYDTSATPTDTTRDVTISLYENGATTPVVTTGSITVVPSDDSPVLDTTVPVSLTAAGEVGNSTGTPTGPVGTAINTLINSANVTDSDGANLFNGQSTAGSTPGIAITAATTTAGQPDGSTGPVGTWYYTTDGGTKWAALTLAPGQALNLVADSAGQDRVYFQPTDPNWNGTIPNALTFRAWDQADGVHNGTVTTLPTNPALGTGTDGTTTPAADYTAAYSSASESVPLVVTAVNNAPLASGGATLATGTEDVTTGPARTVSSLFSGNFSDSADQQNSTSNTTGSNANTLAGVAITGNTANPATQGVWQYSTDGTNWNTISTDVSANNALVLSQGAQLRFDPAANFNGQPPGLTATLIDSSDNQTGAAALSGSGADAVYGATLANATTAMALTGIDVTTTGAATSLSATSVALDTSVAPVNDAPTMTGAPQALTTPEDSAGGPSTAAQVGTLFNPVFSDSTDQQKAAGGITASAANTLAGIAITGDAADPATQGTWQYSTDGGSSWTALPSGLSTSNALVLSKGAELQFVPVANYNGQPGGLTTQVIDNSGAADGAAALYTDGSGKQVYGVDLANATNPIAQSGVDVSTAGGTSSISATTEPLTVQVASVNDAPTVVAGKETETLAAGTEDATTPPSASVNDLFNPSFNDATDQQNATSNTTGSNANTLAGVAITGNTANPATQGVWQYSTDGTHWNTISTDVSAGSALVLSKGAQLRFDPAANFNGQPPGLTATLIDSSDNQTGAAALSGSGADAVYGATLANATAPMALTGIDVTTTGGTTSLSATSVALDTSVAQVNDAPTVVAGKETETLAAGTEDETTPPAASVHDLFNPSFNDTTDDQQAAGGPTASTANTLAGVAITGNTANPATQGVWQYSTDGTNWNTISTDVSANNALVLSQGAQLRFDPAANFNGQPPGLTATLIDSSDNQTGAAALSGSGAGAVYGATLANATTAMALTGIDVTTTGAATSLSATSVALDTSVAPLNDAPTMTGAPQALTTPEDSAGGPSTAAQVATLFNPVFSDSTDQQKAAGGITASAANTLAGIAITGDAADPVTQGTWQYSTDGGSSWTALPSGLSTSNALVLSKGAELQFVPVANYNGQPGGLTTQVIDNSGAADGAAALYTDGGKSVYGVDLANATNPIAQSGVDVSTAGGTSSISATTEPLTVQVTSVNDAPTVVAGKETETLAAGTEDATTPPSASVNDLFNPSFNDATDQQNATSNTTGSNANTLAGVAITGNTANPATQGVWQYSTDGTHWNTISTDVSAGSALVLSKGAQLRFDPAANFNGQPPGLTATLIDSSDNQTGAAALSGSGADAVYGATLANATAPMALTGIDVTTTGGTTSLSATSVALDTSVAQVNDAPTVVAGKETETLAAGTEDETTPPAASVHDLFNPSFNDTTDDQQAAGGPTASTANTLAGVAITGNTANPATQGVWQYSTDGTNWNTISTDVSANNALVLSQGAQLRFDPAANFNGQPPGLTATLIDSSDNQTGAAALSGSGAGAVYGATLANATTAMALTGIDVTTTGAATSLSATSVALDTSVAPLNDAPTMTGAPQALTTPEDSAGGPSTAAQVATLFNPVFSDSTDQQKAAGGITASAANTLAGIAITGDAADPVTQGTWQYSTDGGSSWTALPSGLSTSNALVLSKGAELQFVPVANYNGQPGGLTTQVIDNSGAADGAAALYTDGGKSVYGVDLANATNPIAQSGVDVSTAGGTSSISATTEPLTVQVTPVNDAPIATGSATLISGTEDATGPAQNVSTLFGGNFSDTVDQQPGSSANSLAGVAITGDAATPDQGTWKYSTDNGQTWTALPADLSPTNALVLSGSAQLQFDPAPNYNGQPGSLTATLIDSSTDVPVYTDASGNPVTGAQIATGSTAQTGVDVSQTGGKTALSVNSVPLDTTVTAVNDAPALTGAPTMPAVPEDTATSNAPGSTVASLLTPVFTDQTDQQHSASNSTGSTANTIAGMAITADAADPATQGVWRYSTDGGQSWTALPSDLSPTNALVLSSNAQLDFVPVANFNGQPGGLTVQAIDSSDSTSGAAPLYTDGSGNPVYGSSLAGATSPIAQSGVDVSTAGGTSSISATTEPLTVQVTPVNDAPIATGSTTLPAGTEDATGPAQNVSTLFGGNFSDTVDQQPGSSANSLAGVAITGDAATPDQGTWKYSTDNGQTWTALPADLSPTNALVLSGSAQLQFDPAPNYNGQPGGLTATLIDSSTDVPVYTDASGNPVTGAQIATGTTAQTGVDVSLTGGKTALSVNSVDLDTSVAPVNDAPIASGSTTLPAGTEDATGPAQSVSTLFGGNFSDTVDQQPGSSANSLAGVAITGDAATPDQGTWKYSTDNGQTWTALPADLSPTNALVLSGSAQLQFDPAPNYNGQPGGLTATLIDSSTDVAVYTDASGNPVTGAQIATGTTAQTGVDVSQTGGKTALSVNSVDLDTSVAPVNDAPIATGSATLISGTTDTPSPAQTVGTLFGGNFSDTADQQKSAGNPDGSTANSLAGIAITGDAATASQGTWRYSTDGGKSWQSIDPATLSPSAAIILPATAQLSFQPASNFSGSPGQLTVALIETGSTLINGTDASRADVSGLMTDPTSAVSNTTVDLSTTVANTRPQGIPILPGAIGSNGESPAATLTSSVDSAFDTIFQRGVAAAHQTWIFGTPINHFIVVDQPDSLSIPMGAFLTDDGTESQLELSASLADGSSLPDWLSFDTRSRVFTGTAPESAFGSLDIKVRGRDVYGHEAEVDVHIVIGHQHQLTDMIDLQAVPRAIHQTLDSMQTTVNRLLLDPHLASINDHPSAHSKGKPSLRTQLRHLGAKAHQRDARALLDTQAFHA